MMTPNLGPLSTPRPRVRNILLTTSLPGKEDHIEHRGFKDQQGWLYGKLEALNDRCSFSLLTTSIFSVISW